MGRKTEPFVIVLPSKATNIVDIFDDEPVESKIMEFAGCPVKVKN